MALGLRVIRVGFPTGFCENMRIAPIQYLIRFPEILRFFRRETRVGNLTSLQDPPLGQDG